MRKLNVILSPTIILIGLLYLAACQPTTTDPIAELIVPTAIISAQPDSPAIAEPTPKAELPSPPTFQPARPLAGQSTAPPTPQPSPTPPYQVVFVTADDTLNVRSGPGVDNEIVGELAPNAPVAEMTGDGQLVSGSTWVPIQADGLTGWVNARFLTEAVDGEAFCQDEAVMEIVAGLETAVANQDGDQFAKLIHPERGLRIRHAWWNPEVSLSYAEISRIFTSAVSYDWGVQDGSGNPIIGSFRQEILPLLQEDLLLATETGCDEIIHGGTAGIVRLPDGYDAVHYYALHRPGTDEFAGMNWGTWVVGIERWQGNYYVSFLVHYQWEI